MGGQGRAGPLGGFADFTSFRRGRGVTETPPWETGGECGLCETAEVHSPVALLAASRSSRNIEVNTGLR